MSDPNSAADNAGYGQSSNQPPVQQRGQFESQISDADLNLKYDKLQRHTDNVRNLEMIMEKQL